MYWKNYFLVLLASTLYTLLPAQESRLYEIGGIEVVGNKQSDARAIIALSGIRAGDKVEIPGPAVSKAIRTLWQQQLFRHVAITRSKTIGDVIFLEIQVEELPRLSRWAITGLKKQEQKSVEEIAEQQFSKGGILSAHHQNTFRESVQKYFEEKSFADAQISLKQRLNADSSAIHLRVDIDKGTKLKVANLHFRGNEAVSTRKLHRLMDTKEARRLFGSARYLPATLTADKEKLLGYYHTLGYRDARIEQDSFWRDEKGRIGLAWRIDEGRCYYFGHINWEGNAIYPSALLQKQLGIQPGDVYNQGLLDERLFFSPEGRDIQSLYMDNGYLFVRIEPIEKGIRGDTIDLEFRITEGPVAMISEVNIKGNERTHEHVIRRELATQPGQPFSRADVIRSQRELMAMGYFNPEKLGIHTDVDPATATVALEYEVEEKRNEKVELSAGWNPASQQVVGTLGLTIDNFSVRNLLKGKDWSPLPSGDGQRLSLRLQSTGSQYQAANISFSEPWLGGKRPNLFTVAGFTQRFTNGASAGDESFASLSVTGGSLQLGARFRALRRSLAFTLEGSYQHIYLNGYQDIQLDDGSSISSGRFNNLYLKPALTYNTIGDPFFPTRGARITLSAQFTPPFSALGLASSDNENPYRWLEYHKWRFNAEWYAPITRKLVLKASAKMGWLGHYNRDIGTPPFERFELGGNGISSSQAGFVGNDLIALRGYEEGYLEGSRGGGGAAFSKLTLELRYPLFNAQAARGYILGFAEAGNVWKQAYQFAPFNLKPAAGLGLRLQLPMFGTLGFDYGIGFDKPELEGQHWSKFGTFNIVLGIEPE
ncbi:MAG: outer membrane protein assembly factor BamA [Lewinellaceae bacterium]|nr:outer membrane protein assembly factor BamA [Phaeodactylibacter sp.]MCB9347317.1 outer membrane protein assembly factor BamA [Lewinellaceae bacterium]